MLNNCEILRIAVNTRLLLKNKLEGIGWFTFETLKRICNKHREYEFIFIFDRPYDDSFIFSDNITPVVIGPQARHPILFYLWFEFSIPKVLKKYKADIFISPDGYLSLRTKVKSLAVIHDLNFEHYPKALNFSSRLYYKTFFPKFAQKAERIATVSEYSKNDINKLYGINKEKIDVVYNGANEIFSDISKIRKAEVKKQISDSQDYFVYVGALHPRKNLSRLFKAFDNYKKKTNSKTKLVIVGKKMFGNAEMEEVYNKMNYKDEVNFLGYVETKFLGEVLASAKALVYVPVFEGFGIPIVEAFACKTAVITSNVTSMPEVAGDAAILVNPFEINEITDAMIQIEDVDFRKSLLEKSEKQLQKFSWDKSAERLWTSVEKIIFQDKET